MPLPNPSFEPKTHWWRPGAGAASLEVPSKNCALCAPKEPFLAQNGPETHSGQPNKGKRLQTLHVRLDCPVTKSSSLPPNSTICPRNSQKLAKNGPDYAHFVSTSTKTENGSYLGLRGSKPHSEGTYSPHKPPTFCGFQASNSPNETPRPPYQWSLGGTRGQRSPRTVGANGGSTGVPGAKKMVFPKLVPNHFGCSNKCF